MEKQHPFNIFGSSKESTGKKPAKTHPPPANVQQKTPTETIQSVNATIKKIFEMQEELKTKLEDIYEKTGLSRKEIEDFLKNPKNFPPGKWEQIQKDRALLEEKIQAIIGVDKKHVAKQEESKLSKDRKGKLLGGRKNWIPIR